MRGVSIDLRTRPHDLRKSDSPDLTKLSQAFSGLGFIHGKELPENFLETTLHAVNPVVSHHRK